MTRIPLAALIALLALTTACGGDATDEEAAPADAASGDTSAWATDDFWVDATRFTEMSRGRLDTVDMVVRSDDAAWHVQQMNYGDSWIGMTYAAWYVGPDSLVRFAADRQPVLVDDRGNVYQGVMVGDNPRIKVETGTTAVGVLIFEPAIAPEAGSLTLHVNDSTPPVILVGPFGVRHEAGPPRPEVGAGSQREPR